MRTLWAAPFLAASFFALTACSSEPQGDEGSAASEALSAVQSKYVGTFEGVGEKDPKGPAGRRILTGLSLVKDGSYMGGRHPWEYGTWAVVESSTGATTLYLHGMDSNQSAHYPVALSADGHTLTLTDEAGHKVVLAKPRTILSGR